jgi:predicted ATPase
VEYIFKHALTQEVAYNSLLQKRRKEIHENIGEAIEGLYPERLEEFYEILAYHYAESDNLEKAWRYLKLSGEKALRGRILRYLRKPEKIGIFRQVRKFVRHTLRHVWHEFGMDGAIRGGKKMA